MKSSAQTYTYDLITDNAVVMKKSEKESKLGITLTAVTLRTYYLKICLICLMTMT